MDLFVKPYIVKDEKKRVFIVHGICEHSKRYEEFAKRLNKENISVITYDLRGHGNSSGKRGYIKRYKEHIKDLEDIIEKYDNKDVKRYILGHSLGGLIAHMYMVRNKNDIDGLIASGALTDYIKKVKPLKVIGYKWIGFINIKNDFANDSLSKNKQVELDYINDPLVLKKFKLRLAGEMFIKGVKYLKENIKYNNKPILILHGKDDSIVLKEQSENIFNLINHDKKEIIIYDNMYHEILNEIEKEVVYNDIIAWISNN